MSKASSAFFDYFSWARAKKNTEELEKTNPQNPVLNQQDEDFLERITSKEAPPAPLPPSVIKDNGEEVDTDSKETEKAAEAAGTIALPATPSEEATKTLEQDNSADQTMSETPNEQTKAESSQTVEAGEEPKTQADKATEPVEAAKEATQADDAKKGADAKEQENKEPTEATKETASSGEKSHQEGRTWSSYVPSVPSMPSIPTWKSSKPKNNEKSVEEGKSDDQSDSKEEKVDEKIDRKDPEGVKITENVEMGHSGEDSTETQDAKEVSVLLDKLNLSSINNRVFSFSSKSQKLYGEFTIVLKDMINGAPTAYQDMEKLLKDNEGHLDEIFRGMPPFVQTLIKSLPAKLGSTLGPEIMAAASDKPGADMKARLNTASKSSSVETKKRKRTVPDVKSLAKDRGVITSMLSNIVNFLKLRFPFLLTTTNVVMTLSTFILLLVFWYCHKRGKEVRLSKAAEAELAGASGVSEVDDGIYDDSDDSEKADHEEQPGSGVAVAVPEDGEPEKELDASTADYVSEKSASKPEPERDAKTIIEEHEAAQKQEQSV